MKHIATGEKMKRAASLLAVLIAALAATTLASAAIRREPYTSSPSANITPLTATTDAGQVDLNSLFSRYGIDPESDKAHIILT
ncbi:hypothetical protein CBA19CS91_26460 [Paraburkholderia hospita]|nr:hypothetical protein CBA19CS91_26460 [Paraburkholderia hospita]